MSYIHQPGIVEGHNLMSITRTSNLQFNQSVVVLQVVSDDIKKNKFLSIRRRGF